MWFCIEGEMFLNFTETSTLKNFLLQTSEIHITGFLFFNFKSFFTLLSATLIAFPSIFLFRGL